jgi:Tol biopolymer transport system component
MREPNGRTVLMDFGTGLELADDARALAGTPLYLAPEVIAGGDPTKQSDIYSLGVLLFHLASGGFPVKGQTLGEIRRAHAQRERTAVRQLASTLPRALSAVIDRAVSPDSSQRYASATELAAALGRALPDPRRRPARLAIGVVIVAALAVLVRGWRNDSNGGTLPYAGGLIEQEIDQDLQRRVAIRGPAVGNWIPCHPRGSGGIALCDLRDGSIHQLRMPQHAGEFSPPPRAVLSPDARWLAYQWVEQKGKGSSVRVVSVNGTDDRKLYQSAGPVDIQKWTASGDAIVIREGMARPEQRAMLVPIDGGPPRELLRPGRDVTSTDLAPDERRMLITRVAKERSDIAMIDLATGSEVWSLAEPTDDAQALFTPDGSGVVFISDRTGCESLSFLPLKDGLPSGAPLILKDLGRNHAIAFGFGGDGSYLMTSASAWRTSYWSRLDLQRGSVGTGSPLVHRCTEDSKGADWSPDGDRIAYLSGWFGGRAARVIVQRRDGGLERDFSVPGRLSFDSRVRWSPDGGMLAVISLHVDTSPRPDSQLHIIDMAKGRTEPVAADRDSPSILDVRWDPSGNGLFYRSERAIRRLRALESTPQTVYEIPKGRKFNASGFDVSPSDGSIVVGTMPEDGDGCTIHVITPSGQSRDFHRFDGECEAVAWTRDGRTILAATLLRTRAELWKLDVEGGDPMKLLLDADSIWDLSISPDGTELLYSAGNVRPNAVILRGIGGAR